VKWFGSISLVDVSGLDICDGNAKIIHAILTQVSLLILAVDFVLKAVNDSVCLCAQLMRYSTTH
jgi:hypothetical protein